MKLFSPVLLIFLLTFTSHNTYAQKSATNPAGNVTTGISSETLNDSSLLFLVGNIEITGNKKTKAYIILREFRISTGDSLYARVLLRTLEQGRRQIYNTMLFSSVNIRVDSLYGNILNIQISVKEKWYIYPTPQFSLVDRNFNEWVKVYNADLERVIYGVKFEHFNLSGRNDRMRVFLLNGYARNISFTYVNPYSNAALTEGFGVGAGFTQNREVAVKTSYNNRLLNYKKEGFVRTSYTGSVNYLIRRGLFRSHSITGSYTHQKVEDSVITYFNPGYFNKPVSSLGYPEAGYQYLYINTNNNLYPLSGQVFAAKISKRGLGISGGINMTSIDIGYNRYLPHGHNWFSSIESFSKLKLPFEQPYINRRLLGFNNAYLRGLEYYVIDGVAAAVAKYTLRKKLVSFDIHPPIFSKIIPVIPFNFYGKTYGDIGYNYIPRKWDTRLNNSLLYTGGFGIDILSVWDMRLSLEYSFNQLGENGLFLHAKGGF